MLRRQFIKLSAVSAATALYARLTHTDYNAATALINHPDQAWALINDNWVQLTRSNGSVFKYQNVQVEVSPTGNAQAVHVQAPSVELQAIRLQWKSNTSKYVKALGDHWERSYGDLEWKAPQAGVQYPWYMLLHDEQHTACFGVKTGAATLCGWGVNENGITLTLDTHSGGVGVKLGQRRLHAADVVTMLSRPGENAFAADTRFCRLMCEHPRLPKQPVYGINDWYVMYGNNSAESVREQTARMAELVSDTHNRPFSVIDDGWEIADDFSKSNEKFKDMHRTADEIKSLGMRPGLWTRPLIARRSDNASLLAPKIPGRNDANAPILDPTIPENLERVRSNIRLYKQWGYEMVKHDYSSWDIFGRWGMQMKDRFTVPGWKYSDQSRTNAEIAGNLYRAIREVAGNEIYIIGCNTLSHLSAGLFELNRIGDDTSGKEWDRTRKMGVNTLGFRLPHHNTFYAADGDCVGLTKDVPWEKNRQWLQLLAESGAPLFISAQLDFLGSEQKAAVKKAFAQAARPQPTGEPLDWMQNPLPARWKLNGREVGFDWR